MRERELKLRKRMPYAQAILSLPMRERELKPALPTATRRVVRSLPMRERELKLIENPSHSLLRMGRSPCGSAN